MAHAYVPYSRYPVGAAALVDDGRVVTGCNVENASYGLGLCAECGLVSELARTGGGRLLAFACVDGRGERLVPCGRCRQLLYEFGGPGLLLAMPGGVQPKQYILLVQFRYCSTSHEDQKFGFSLASGSARPPAAAVRPPTVFVRGLHCATRSRRRRLRPRRRPPAGAVVATGQRVRRRQRSRRRRQCRRGVLRHPRPRRRAATPTPRPGARRGESSRSRPPVAGGEGRVLGVDARWSMSSPVVRSSDRRW